MTAVALADEDGLHPQRLGGGYVVVGAIPDHDGIPGGASRPLQGAAEEGGVGLVHSLLGGGADDLKVVPQAEPRQPLGRALGLAGDDAQAVAPLTEGAEDSVRIGVGLLGVPRPGGSFRDPEVVEGGQILPHTHGAEFRHLGGKGLIGNVRARDGVADALFHGGGLVHDGGAHIEK